MYPLGPETALGEITPAFSASVYLALVRRPFPPFKPDLERKTGFLESFRKGELIRANLALGSQVSTYGALQQTEQATRHCRHSDYETV